MSADLLVREESHLCLPTLLYLVTNSYAHPNPLVHLSKY